MAISLEKSTARECTPEHLMDEEEAVRTFCPQRENPEESEIMVTTEKEDLPAEQNELAKYLADNPNMPGENLPNEETEARVEKTFNSVPVAIHIFCYVLGFCIVAYAIYVGFEGLKEIQPLLDALLDANAGRDADYALAAKMASVLLRMLACGACGVAIIAVPRIVRKLFNCRRF